MSKSLGVAGLVVCAVLASACGRRDDDVNPESRDPHVHEAPSAALPQVPFRDVVAATFGVTTHEAGSSLERYLVARPEASALLAKWPRMPSGGLDLDRPPVAATSLYDFIGPGSKSRCGEVTVVFGDGATSLRTRLSVPATTPQCRGILRDNHVTGQEALSLLKAAIADVRVPVAANLPVIAAN
jgi:hypothetical protein